MESSLPNHGTLREAPDQGAAGSYLADNNLKGSFLGLRPPDEPSADGQQQASYEREDAPVAHFNQSPKSFGRSRSSRSYSINDELQGLATPSNAGQGKSVEKLKESSGHAIDFDV